MKEDTLQRAAKLADELEQASLQDPKFFTPDPRIEAAKTLRDLVLENSSLQLRVALATECLALAERKLENVKGMVAALGVPAGWKLVPVEPTEDMIVAFAEQWYSHAQTIDDPQMVEAYRALLDAAPQPDAVIPASEPALRSCPGCGEGVMSFCRGRAAQCPMSLPAPGLKEKGGHE